MQLIVMIMSVSSMPVKKPRWRPIYNLTPVCILRALKASGNRLYCFSLACFTNCA
jgi:hypothetical protein